MNRRAWLKGGGGAALAVCGLRFATTVAHAGPADPLAARPDCTIRIGTGLLELAPDRIVSTTTYNGQFPGPLLRFKEGQRVVVDIHNDTDTPEQLHWHGQVVPVDVDGAAEEGTPYIPAHGMRRVAFTPGPAGFRFYHTHRRAGSNLHQGQYTGQVGTVYIEPKREPGAYDREVFLVLKEFEPELSRGGDVEPDFLSPATRAKALEAAGEAAMRASLRRGMPHGYEVGYRLFSINGRMLGHGDDPREGGRTRPLPRPQWQRDGDPESRIVWPHVQSRRPRRQPCASACRGASAVARHGRAGLGRRGHEASRHLGAWRSLGRRSRARHMGIAVEYAGRKGKPRWVKPRPSRWDYTRFADPRAVASTPDEVIEMTFEKRNAADRGFNEWTINGVAFSMDTTEPRFHLRQGRRYRLRMRNASDDIHPMHLHRHSFELTRIAGKPTAGVTKDVAMLGGYQEMEVDFTADNPGLTLLHCHMQLHMDYGFMALFDYL